MYLYVIINKGLIINYYLKYKILCVMKNVVA